MRRSSSSPSRATSSAIGATPSCIPPLRMATARQQCRSTSRSVQSCRPQARHPPASRQRLSRATRTILGRCCIRKLRFEGAAARPHRRAKSATALAATALAATVPTPPPSPLPPRPPPPSPPPSSRSPPQSYLPPSSPLLPLAAPALAIPLPPPSPFRCRPPLRPHCLAATDKRVRPRNRDWKRPASPPSPPSPPPPPSPGSDLSAELAATEPAAALAATAYFPALTTTAEHAAGSGPRVATRAAEPPAAQLPALCVPPPPSPPPHSPP